MGNQMFIPLVSIIIPVFNGSNFLSYAIDSALSQTYKKKEIIVVNDGSTDGGKTRTVALSYGKEIRYYEKENGGVSTALNFGIRKANGDYIAWLSHDDLFSANKIENQIAVLASSDVSNTIPFSMSSSIDKNGKKDRLDFFVTNRHHKFSGVCHFFPINMCLASCLIPRSYLLSSPFNEEARFTQDIEKFFDLLLSGFVFVPTRKTYYFGRNHEGRVTVTRKDLFQKDTISFHQKLMSYIRKTADLKFAQKYLLYCTEKSQKYPVFAPFIQEIKNYLAANNQLNFWIKLKCDFVALASRLGFSLRRSFAGR